MKEKGQVEPKGHPEGKLERKEEEASGGQTRTRNSQKQNHV